jgi:uncharacterized protein (UPF0210 family)
MIAVPGDTPASTIAAIIADEVAKSYVHYGFGPSHIDEHHQ